VDAEAIAQVERTKVVEVTPAVVDWKVRPDDPLLRELGIRYVAFDSEPPASITEGLK
jgi:hypothetical protein